MSSSADQNDNYTEKGGLTETVGKTLQGSTRTVGNVVSGLGATIGGAVEEVGQTATGAAQGLGSATKGLGQSVNQGFGPVPSCHDYGTNPAYPSTFRPLAYKLVRASQEHEKWTGAVVAEQIPVANEDFVQANGLWEVLGRQLGQQKNLVKNISGHLCGAHERVRRATYGMFRRVNKDLGARIEAATEANVAPSARL